MFISISKLLRSTLSSDQPGISTTCQIPEIISYLFIFDDHTVKCSLHACTMQMTSRRAYNYSQWKCRVLCGPTKMKQLLMIMMFRPDALVVFRAKGKSIQSKNQRKLFPLRAPYFHHSGASWELQSSIFIVNVFINTLEMVHACTCKLALFMLPHQCKNVSCHSVVFLLICNT